MTHFRHLTYNERKSIENALNKRLSIRQISISLERSPQTISREIKRNRRGQNLAMNPYRIGVPNDCALKMNCGQQNLCERCTVNVSRCALCEHCNQVCSRFTKITCESRDISPGVCNGCHNSSSCRLRKVYYRAKPAEQMAKKRLVEARSGFTFTEKEIDWLDQIFSSRILKGQSIHSIYMDHLNEMPCTERTVYTLLRNGLFTAKTLDLRMAVKRKVRKKRKEFKIDKMCRLGRSYQDFLKYKQDLGNVPEVQMDTVLGPLGSTKAFLTLYWCQASFLMVFLLERKSSEAVIQVFDRLKKELGERAL